MRAITFIFLLISTACAGAASDVDDFGQRVQANVAPRTPTNTERFEVPRVDKLDVLFVVDDSGSMSLKQEKLKQALPTFLTSMETASPSLSWRIGVVTTDVYRADVLRNKAALAKPWVDLEVCPPASCDAVEKVRQNLDVGTAGSGDEKPLLAIMRALDPAFGNDVGFRRSDADLLVVIVTDEEDSSCAPVRPDQGGCLDDISYGPPEYYTRFLRGFVDAPHQVRVAAIVGVGSESLSDTLTGCRSEDNASDIAQTPPRITAVTNAVGGVVESICQADLTSALQRIALDALRMPRVSLDRVPSLSSLEVVVNEGAALQEGVDFDFARCADDGRPINEIRFRAGHVPAEGSSILVSYAVDSSTAACE